MTQPQVLREHARMKPNPSKFDLLQPSPQFLWAMYLRLGSVHKVAKELGTFGNRIHQNLIKAGYRLRHSRWTKEEDQTLTEFYARDTEEFSVPVIAKQLNRTEDAITLRAGQLRLTKKNRKNNSGAKLNMKNAHAARPNKYPGFNKGRKFGPLSDLQKEKLSAALKAKWDNAKATSTIWMSESGRQKSSDRMTRRQHSGEIRGGYNRAAGGFREDIGIFVRSSWEANIARYLNWMVKIGAVIRWEYESETFWFENIKRGTRSYTPDFKIWFSKEPNSPVFWEVKGWMDQKSRTKLDRMGRMYPDVKIVVIGNTEYKAISSESRHVIQHWESKPKRSGDSEHSRTPKSKRVVGVSAREERIEIVLEFPKGAANP